ncbi:protein translocase subunit SecD [Rhodovibrionaceae bacterium A322]
MVQIPRWQWLVVIGVLLLGLVYSAPNFVKQETLDSLPDWMPNQQINLGLDLRGGSYLLLQVDVDTVFREQLEAVVDTVRDELRGNNRASGKRYTYRNLRVEDEKILFSLQKPEDIDEVRPLIAPLLGPQDLLLFEDNGDGSIELSEASQRERRNAVMQQSIEIIRRRIDETGTKEPTIQRQGDDRILIQLPGVDDPERVKDLIGRTAKLTFQFVNSDLIPGVDRAPAGHKLLPSDDEAASGRPVSYIVNNRVIVSGENLVDAQATFQDASPVVSFRFDTVGAQKFGNATRSENVGRLFAIILDGKVISAPRINEPILGGAGIISGNFSTVEAQDLALLLRAGALPAELTVLEERSVGPGLGADSIAAGEFASALGLVLVIVFMAAVYGLFGMMACVALVVNLMLMGALLSLLQATLTLPGIAGIVLTIGMAVDANVLIFERIREEIRAGRGPISAVDSGYRRAMTTILDSNLTTLIAALLLFNFGTGPVRGFAVTLAIGLITSMFSAIMVTRLMVVTWLRRKRSQNLPI